MKMGAVDARPGIVKLMDAAFGKEPGGTGESGLVIAGEQIRGKGAKAVDGITTQGTLGEGNWLGDRPIAL